MKNSPALTAASQTGYWLVQFLANIIITLNRLHALTAASQTEGDRLVQILPNIMILLQRRHHMAISGSLLHT